jgi:hypothetical protein
MNRHVLLGGAFLLALAIASGRAFPFDNERKGFILGTGLGSAFVSLEHAEGTDTRLATDFRIGYAPTERFEIYWMCKSSWSRMEDMDEIELLGFAGVATTYFLKPRSPSAYLVGGIGYSYWDYTFTTEDESEWADPAWVALGALAGIPVINTGAGVLGGLGYEFARHWSVECDLLWGSYHLFGYSRGVRSIRITINGLAY